MQYCVTVSVSIKIASASLYKIIPQYFPHKKAPAKKPGPEIKKPGKTFTKLLFFQLRL